MQEDSYIWIAIGKYVKKVFPMPTIAITGSAGKTTCTMFAQCVFNEKYNVKPEFLWDNFEGGVFRNKKSNKWFGVIMNINKSKIIPKENGEVEVLNLKLDNDVEKYLKIKGIYPAYHMNKKNWMSIILDDTICDNKIL